MATQRRVAPKEPRLKVEDDGRLVHNQNHKETKNKEKDEDEQAEEVLLQNPASGITTDNDVRFRTWLIMGLVLQPIIGIFGAMPVMLPRHGYGHFDLDVGEVLHYIVAVWLAIQYGYNLVMFYAADPGRLTRKIKPQDEVTGQFRLNLPADKLPAHLQGESLYYAPRWCYKCKLWQPPRARHCDICRYCVLRHDHHSVLTNRCVGVRNHGYWALYNLYAIFGGIYSLYLAWSCVHNSWDDRLIMKEIQKHKWYSTNPNPETHAIYGTSFAKWPGLFMFMWNDVGHSTFLFLILSVVCGFYAGLMGCTNTYDTMQGITRTEKDFEMQEYLDLQGGSVAPINSGFYRQPWGWDNFLAMLGPNWCERLILPVPGEPLPEQSFMPPLAPEARKQVTKRMEHLAREKERENAVL